jgi:predicted esterase
VSNHRLYLALLLAGLICVLISIAIPQKELPDWKYRGYVDNRTDELFDIKSIQYNLGGGTNELHYRIFEPKEPKSAEPLKPLLIWLHGRKESGEDNRDHLRWMNLLLQSKKDFPGYILAYQCSSERPVWTQGPEPEQSLSVVRAIVDEVISECPVDVDRIYVSGVSSGGTGCWQMLLRYPDLIAAAVPLAGSGVLNTDLSSISDVPVWAFHTRQDPMVPVSGVRATIGELQELGGKAYLTETPGHTHDCWTVAFGEFEFIDWLLAQRKGEIGPAPDSWRSGVAFRLALQPIRQAGVQYYLPIPIFILICWYIRRTNSKYASNSNEKNVAPVST